MSYLAIDPGGARTGWASFNSDGAPVSQGIVETKEDGWELRLLDLLERRYPDVIVVEKFKLYPWKATAQGFSQFRQSQVIGAVSLWVAMKKKQLVLQEPSVMSVGFKYQGKTKPTHPKDDEAAKAHGVYYLVNLGKMRAAQ